MFRILHGVVVEYRSVPVSTDLGLNAFGAASYAEALACSNTGRNISKRQYVHP
jgi:hypothetical protein